MLKKMAITTALCSMLRLQHYAPKNVCRHKVSNPTLICNSVIFDYYEQNLFRSPFHISTFLNVVIAARFKLQTLLLKSRAWLGFSKGMQSFPSPAGILPRRQIHLFSRVWFDEIQFAFRSSMPRLPTEDRVLQAVIAGSKIGKKNTALWFEN